MYNYDLWIICIGTLLITFILTTILWYMVYKNIEIDMMKLFILKFYVPCNPDTKITYRYGIYRPANNKIYEKRLADALYDISIATSSATCLTAIETPPNFTNQLRLEGLEPINNNIVLLSYIFWNSQTQEACFSFTGTELVSEWFSDFDYKQIAPVNLHGYHPDIMAHQGFYNLYLAVQSKLWTWWQTHKSEIKTLYLTGHSLGGALSILCAFDFADIEPIHYSFGAPRCGNSHFVNTFNKRMPNSIRINNTEDIVPTLPPSVCNGYYYEQVHGNMPFTKTYNDLVKNHTLAYYHLPDCPEVIPCTKLLD